jgi:hypothetical protein
MREITEFVTEIPLTSINTMLAVVRRQNPGGRAIALALGNGALYGAGFLFPEDGATTQPVALADVSPMTLPEAEEYLVQTLEANKSDEPGAKALLGGGKFLKLVKLVLPILVDLFVGLETGTEATPA